MQQKLISNINLHKLKKFSSFFYEKAHIYLNSTYLAFFSILIIYLFAYVVLYLSSLAVIIPIYICDYSMSTPPKEGQKNTCPTNQQNDEDNQSSSSLHFELLTLHDRKGSYDSELLSLREPQSCFPEDDKEHEKGRKGRGIQKKERDHEADRRAHQNRKRRILQLEHRVEELQREVASLRRNEHSYCLACRNRLPQFCRQRYEVNIQPEESAACVAGDPQGKKSSKDSLEFQKIDFNAPLVQSQEMQQKLWIFVGTILIAMGSKVTDFDGTINIFKVLKHSVDRIRQQVEKCQPKIGLEFFYSKQQMNEPQNFIDEMIFDPFYSQKREMSLGNFTLDGIKIESVEQYQLFYDNKYQFHIKYDALLSIIEYARDNCSIS